MSKDLENFFIRQFDEHNKVASDCQKRLQPSFLNVIKICISSLKRKKKILFFGNGGSASDAQHLATEFLIRLKPNLNRSSIPAISLTLDSSVLTACGNDYGFENVFSRTLESLGNKNKRIINRISMIPSGLRMNSQQIFDSCITEYANFQNEGNWIDIEDNGILTNPNSDLYRIYSGWLDKFLHITLGSR